MIVGEAERGGVGAAVLDETVSNRHPLNDGGGVGGDLLRGEAEPEATDGSTRNVVEGPLTVFSMPLRTSTTFVCFLMAVVTSSPT